MWPRSQRPAARPWHPQAACSARLPSSPPPTPPRGPAPAGPPRATPLLPSQDSRPLGARDTAAGQPGARGGCPGAEPRFLAAPPRASPGAEPSAGEPTARTGRCTPSCWTSSRPRALPVLTPLCLSSPFTRGWGGRSGSRHPVASPRGSGRLLGAFPLRSSPRAGLGDHPRGGIDGAGPPPSSWLPRWFFLSPFFRSDPLKLSFPTRCCSRWHTMGMRGARLRCSITGRAVAKGFHLCAIALSPAAPKGIRQGPGRDHVPWAPQGACAGARLQTGRPCQELAGSAPRRVGGTDRQPAGRWAARREAARHGGRAKVGGGFSCSDCLSPPQRFLLPGRKPAAERAAAP